MIPQHPEEEVCLDYLVGELPAEERSVFEEHLGECAECRLRLKQYRGIFRGGLPSLGDEFAEVSGGVLGFSGAAEEQRLRDAVRDEMLSDVPHRIAVSSVALGLGKPRESWWRDGLRTGRSQGGALAVVGIAAMLVAAVGLGESLYRMGLKHGLEQARAVGVAVKPIARVADDGVLRGQLQKLSAERDGIRAGALQREAIIIQLREQIEQQRSLNEATEASLRIAGLQMKDEEQQISTQRDELEHKLETQQAALAATQEKLDGVQQVGASDTIRAASLESRIQQITQALKDKDATIEEQQKMLASDRDIRDLMSARDLYFSEMWDVGGDGKRMKPFGRVFYTKGKSLIFYGYDLDQEPGIKNASTFQVWGLRGPDKSTALNLGVVVKYADNSANRRWILKFDDPKALEQINAVFVTAEPNGASRVPRGKQLFLAYLNEQPNHP